VNRSTPLGLALRSRRLLLAVFTAAGADLAALALMATAAWLITRAAEQPPLAALTVAIVAVRALATSRGVFRYLDRLMGHDAVLRCLAELRTRVFTALVPTAPLGLGRLRHGDLLSRVVSDVDAVQDALLRCLLPAAVAGVVSVVAVGAAALALPAAAVVLAAGLLLAGVVLPLAAAGLTARAARRTAHERGVLAATAVDLLHGAADLAAYGADREVLRRAEATSRRLAALERSTAVAGGALSAAGIVVQTATVLGVTALASAAAASGRLSGPLVAALALGSLTAVETVLPLIAAGRRWVEVRAGVARVSELLAARPEAAGPAVRTEPVRPVTPPEPEESVELRLRDVTVRYDPDGPPAVSGVDLDLPQGRRVALVGPSGSGKSTLLTLLAGFVAPAAGEVTLNGVPLERFAGDDLRRVVGGALADAHVFHAPLRANLRLARPEATEDELRAVAERVRLAEWVDELPAGWDTVVGEDGGLLSGGQRQRLVLARALLANPRVLLLDEPTEGLDPATADAVLADVLAAAGGRTVLLATHRLRGLEEFDEIVVLEGGRVLQRGSHAELLNQPGYYRDRWQAERLAETAYPVG